MQWYLNSKLVNNTAALIPSQRYSLNSSNEIKSLLVGDRYLYWIFVVSFPRSSCELQLFALTVLQSRVGVGLHNQPIGHSNVIPAGPHTPAWECQLHAKTTGLLRSLCCFQWQISLHLFVLVLSSRWWKWDDCGLEFLGLALEIRDEGNTCNSGPEFSQDPLSACYLQDVRLTHCEHEGCCVCYAVSSPGLPCGSLVASSRWDPGTRQSLPWTLPFSMHTGPSFTDIHTSLLNIHLICMKSSSRCFITPSPSAGNLGEAGGPACFCAAYIVSAGHSLCTLSLSQHESFPQTLGLLVVI